MPLFFVFRNNYFAVKQEEVKGVIDKVKTKACYIYFIFMPIK